jgi:hypothetical protein
VESYQSVDQLPEQSAQNFDSFTPEPLWDSEAQLNQELSQAPPDQPPEPPLVAPRSIDSTVQESNILEGRRERRSTHRDDCAYFAAPIHEDYAEEPQELLAAFATGLNAEQEHHQHRDDLPPPPQNWKDMLRHPHCEAFLAAAARETNSLRAKGTFQEVKEPNDRSVQVLPLKWVFDYKFDQDGNLRKFKARLCVRGDLEKVTPDEKRAATLAARTARIIFGLVAAFNWDVRQLDAVNAFLNSTLPKPVYTKLPDGSTSPPGLCWKLEKALYGLRISPKL